MQKRFKCLFASVRSRVRSSSSPPKRKTRQKSCLSFWVPRRMAALRPSVIEMLGGSEFLLSQGFACGKTLVTRHSARPPEGGIYSVAMLHVGASFISLAPTFFTKVRARSFCCSSFPNRTRCAGLRFGFGCRPGGMSSKLFARSKKKDSLLGCPSFWVTASKGRLHPFD